MHTYTNKIITNIDESFIKEWNDLWEISENANTFNTYGWFLVTKETLKTEKFEIHACYKENRLVAVVALFFEKRFGITIASSQGYKPVNTPFLMKEYDEAIFKAFFGDIIKTRNIYFAKVDKNAVDILHRLFPKMFFSLISANPYLDRNENPELFLSTTNHKNARRIIKKLGNDLTFKTYDHNDDLMKYLTLLFAVEQKSEKKLRSMDIFSKEETRNFFINIVKHCSQLIKIHILYYQNNPIAYTFNFTYRNMFTGYQTSYLSEYKKFYPGKVILVHDLESLRDTTFDIFNLGGGVSSYKLEFAPTYFFLYDLYFSKNSLHMLWWKAINFARRIKQILFPIKHTRDHEFLFKTLK